MISKLINLLLANQCLFCLAPCCYDIPLCHDCEHELPYIINPCISCATPLPSNSTNICGRCLIEPPPYQYILAICQYNRVSKRFIHALKFNQQLIYAKLCSYLMLKNITTNKMTKPELIIPIPLHRKRLHQRSYNQALELAKPIAKKLQIPIDFTSCQRIRNTKPQAEIPAKQRRSNIKGAFSIDTKKLAKIKHIAIVDDVITTGNTVAELSNMLRQIGVKIIQVWCFARTISKATTSNL